MLLFVLFGWLSAIRLLEMKKNENGNEKKQTCGIDFSAYHMYEEVLGVVIKCEIVILYSRGSRRHQI